MFRTSYAHLQEDYIVHAALYGMLSMLLCKHSFNMAECLHKCIENIPKKGCMYKYSLPEDEHNIFETCSRQDFN